VDLRAQLARLKTSCGVRDRVGEHCAVLPEPQGAALDAASGAPQSATNASAALPSPPASSPAPSLAERLRELGRVRSPPADRREALAALARLAGGELVAPGLLLVERRHALPFDHGQVCIGFGEDIEIDVPVRRRLSLRARAADLALLDTETSGLAGGTGTFVFLVGIGRFASGALVVRQWLMASLAAEAALLAGVRAALADAACLVTYNGKSFDVPLLKTRFALVRAHHPFAALAHADLLHATRRRLHRHWPDCRLRTTESRALGFARQDDLPGAQVPVAWQRWLRHGDAAAVPRILAHNRLDLLSLAALLELHRHPTKSETPLLQALDPFPSPADLLDSRA
jgi:uncharacterized protein YprB with RNaseH-like and TPR domain